MDFVKGKSTEIAVNDGTNAVRENRNEPQRETQRAEEEKLASFQAC